MQYMLVFMWKLKYPERSVKRSNTHLSNSKKAFSIVDLLVHLGTFEPFYYSYYAL